jgi:hypothetical protein
MSIAEELRKLQHVHETGGLTDAEFAAAKAAVLGATKMDSELAMAAHFDALKVQSDLERLEREWEVEREQYMLRSKYGQRYVPTRAMSIVVGVVMASFGIFWTTASAQGSGSAYMSILGIIPILAGIGFGIYSHSKAVEYEQAFSRYQRRRSRLLEGPPDEQFARS